jgi:cytochrome c553
MTMKALVSIFAISMMLHVGIGTAVAEEATEMSAKDLWSKNCASCHGADGKGDTKMGKKLHVEDLTSAEVKAKFDRDSMIAATRDGVKNEEGKQVMKPFAEKLTAEEIGKITDYIIGGFSG